LSSYFQHPGIGNDEAIHSYYGQGFQVFRQGIQIRVASQYINRHIDFFLPPAGNFYPFSDLFQAKVTGIGPQAVLLPTQINGVCSK
jgi:hypothetical protein